MTAPPYTEEDLHKLQKSSFGYFLHEADASTGLVRDSTHAGSPASIAAAGLGARLVHRGRGASAGSCSVGKSAAGRSPDPQFFWNSPQGEDADAAGYKGFFYHFLDMRTGRRAWNCELSTVDTAHSCSPARSRRRHISAAREARSARSGRSPTALRRVDWQWAANGGRR